MTPTKLLIGQIFLVLAIVAAGLWASTQWAASMLAYQPALGTPLIVVGDTPVYRPWSLFVWWFHYEAYAPAIFDKAGALAALSGLLGCTAAIGGSLLRARQASNVTTYGSARWASTGEVRRAGLVGSSGVFLGRLGRDYLRHDGPEHVMLFAPTRSGKGAGLVIPTLLSWTGSAVIHDIKGENWRLTAGWRARFSNCLLFDPTNPSSARYNPLLEVRMGPNEVRDVQNIADILVDPEGALERRNHWEKTGHSLLVGAILHVKWIETNYEQGSPLGTSRWTAILAVDMRPPANADALRKNPLGLYVEAIDWSKELDPSEAAVPAPPVPAKVIASTPPSLATTEATIFSNSIED